MTVNLKNLRATPNIWVGAILFICICIELGIIFLIFLHPKSLHEIFFVPVKVSVLNEEFQKIENVKVYGIDPGNAIKAGNLIGDKGICPIKKLILSIPKDNIEDFKQVQISLGKKHFLYTRRQLLQNWKKSDEHFNKEKAIIDYVNFEAPPEVKTNSILQKLKFAVFSTDPEINGNPKLLNIIKECLISFHTPILFIILLILLLSFAIFSLKYPALNKNTYVSMILPNIYYNHQKKFDWVHMALVFILTFVTASFFSRLRIDVLHHGFMLQAAVNMSEGKMLFKDIYFHYGPLTAILQSLAIDIFGKKLIVIQIETALFYALTSIFLWLIWSRFMKPVLATISCIVWLFLAPYFEDIFLPWSSVHSLFFLTLSLYIFILALEKKKQRYLYMAGMSASLTFWSRQPEGILLFSSIVSSYFILHILQKSNVKVMLKGIGVFLAGNITISIVFFTWIVMNLAFNDWWVQCFTGIVSWAFTDSLAFSSEGTGFIFKAISSSKAFFPCNFWVLLPLFAFLTLVSVIFNIVNKKKVDKQSQALLVILFVSLTNWLNYFPTSCWRHCYWAATPLVGVVVFYFLCLWKLFVKFWKLRKNALSLGLALFIYLFIIITGVELTKKIVCGIKKHAKYSYEVTKPDVLSGMMVAHESQVEALKKLDVTIQTYLTNFPGTSLISLSNINILFLTLVDNNNLFSPLPTPTSSKILFKTYKYREKLSKCIEQKKVLIFADKPKILPGYRELTHIPITPTLLYPDRTWYLYAPIQAKVKSK